MGIYLIILCLFTNISRPKSICISIIFFWRSSSSIILNIYLVKCYKSHKIWPIGWQRTWYALAICLSLSGTSCFASDSKSTNPGAIFIFDSLKNEVAHPVLPARPVRPIRWTYSSTSDGKSKLITWRTFEMSNPLAATAVATRIGAWPLWKTFLAKFLAVFS